MYNQFCKNLKSFIDMNAGDSKNLRLKLAKELVLLTDVKKYNKDKKRSSLSYKQASTLIFFLNNYKEDFPSLDKFIWELWAYGFDPEYHEDLKDKVSFLIEEKAKLVDLLLGTHYIA